MSAPTFSVITVCFNGAAVLPGAMASLAAQRGADFEWVFVDGGSRDGSVALAKASGLPMGNWVSEPDRGIYDAMNKAVAMSRGDILYFLNTDDALFDAQVLADVAQAFATHPGLDLLWGDVEFVYPDRRVAKRYAHINRWTLPFEDLCHQGTFVRRSLFERFGPFRLDFPTSADYDWLLRVFADRRTRLAYLPRMMARFTADGSHTKHAAALAAERERVRLQYMGRPRLAAGIFASRAMHKLSKMTRGGMSWGERPVGPAP